MIFLLFATLLDAGIAHAGAPPWALKESAQLKGRVLSVACSGAGPGVAQARQEAIDGCKMSATQYLMSDVRTKSLSISTERDVAYQQEVLNQSQVSGLA